jgi:hypothetical protein
MISGCRIEYACLVDGTLSLHIAKPQLAGSNSNQYTLIFEQKSDTAIACIVGDWEYASFTACLIRFGEYITQNSIPSSKRIAVGGSGDAEFFIPATLELRRPSDGGLFRLTISFDSTAQQPHLHSLYQRRASKVDSAHRERTFRLYLQESELISLANILTRLDDTAYEPIIESSCTDWFYPAQMQKTYPVAFSVALRTRLQKASDYISATMPKGISVPWVLFLSNISTPTIHQCPKCDRYFPASAKWQKVCHGCYTRGRSSGITHEEIEGASAIYPWLLPLETT